MQWNKFENKTHNNNDYENDNNKRKGNNCNKKVLIDYWKRSCKPTLQHLRFQTPARSIVSFKLPLLLPFFSIMIIIIIIIIIIITTLKVLFVTFFRFIYLFRLNSFVHESLFLSFIPIDLYNFDF